MVGVGRLSIAAVVRRSGGGRSQRSGRRCGPFLAHGMRVNTISRGSGGSSSLTHSPR